MSLKYYLMEEEHRSERNKSETLGGEESPADGASPEKSGPHTIHFSVVSRKKRDPV